MLLPPNSSNLQLVVTLHRVAAFGFDCSGRRVACISSFAANTAASTGVCSSHKWTFGRAPPMQMEMQDITGDGKPDLILTFDQAILKLNPRTNSAFLSG